MTDKRTVKVGDVVAWDEVPSGAMVKCEYAVGSGFAGDIDYAMRIGDEGYETADELRTLAEAFEREHPAT